MKYKITDLSIFHFCYTCLTKKYLIQLAWRNGIFKKNISDTNFVLIYIVIIAFSALLISTNTENSETNALKLSDTSEQKILQQIFPAFCSASSVLDSGWSCENLYDDEYSIWQDNSLACKDGWIEFTFYSEIYLEFIVFQNPEDPEYFIRNHKVRNISIKTSKNNFVLNKEFKNDNSSQWLDINTTTDNLRIDILSAYPSQEYNGKVPFDECAVQEIIFYGRDL